MRMIDKKWPYAVSGNNSYFIRISDDFCIRVHEGNLMSVYEQMEMDNAA